MSYDDDNSKKTKFSLTAEERETVISWSDSDTDRKLWIYTSQQPMIRKLRKNPYFELLREHKSNAYHHNIIAIEGYLPVNFLTIRSKKRTISKKRREQARQRMINMHKALKSNDKTRFSKKPKQVNTLSLDSKSNFENFKPNNKNEGK